MAEFNQTPQAQQPGSYVGLSEGIRSSADTSLATLFEGLAGAFDGAVKVVDADIKDRIEKDIFAEVDAVQAEFGIPEATDLERDADEQSFATSPIGVQRAQQQLNRLQTAYARGAIKESNYWARMNNMVRQLRGKYPGYRAEIDQMVASVTGQRPANALRSALMSEWNAAANSESGMDKLVDWATKNGRLPADFHQRMASENPYDETELQAHVARKTREAEDLKDMQSQMAFADSRGRLTKQTVQQNFARETTQIVTSLLQDAAGTVGADYTSVRNRIIEAQKAAASGTPMSQQEVDMIRGQMGQLRATLRTQLHQASIRSWDNDPTHSYTSHLDKTEIDAAIAHAMVPLDILEQGLTDPSFGILSAQAAWLEAQKTDSSVRILQDMPFAQDMAALANVLGAEALGQFLTLTPALQTELDQALKSYYSVQMATSKQSGKTVAEAFADGEKAGVDTEYYNGVVSQWTNLVDKMVQNDIPLSVVQNAVSFMFGPGSDRVYSMLDDSGKFEYFKKTTNPAVTKKMMELRDMGDVESWKTYQDATINTFQTLFRDNVATLQNLVLDPNLFRVTWDDRNARFNIDLRVVGDTYVRHPFPTAVNQLNDAIQSINPIVVDEKGQTGPEILLILQSLGYDPNASAPESALSILGDAVMDAWRRRTESGDVESGGW